MLLRRIRNSVNLTGSSVKAPNYNPTGEEQGTDRMDVEEARQHAATNQPNSFQPEVKRHAACDECRKWTWFLLSPQIGIFLKPSSAIRRYHSITSVRGFE